jgi:hypothetical protein
MSGYHTLTPFRVQRNQFGRIMKAVKYGRRTIGHDLTPVLYIEDHNGSLSNEEMEAVLRACNSKVDEALRPVDESQQAPPLTADDI